MRTIAPWIALLFACTAARAAKTLDIYFVDVEGGQATLVVAPGGQSLLIDAGFTGNGGRDADRIARAAKAAGVKHLDALLVTHFHPDHSGGVPNVIERLPATTFLDHGPSVEAEGKYPEAYAAAIAKGQHRVLQAGETIMIKAMKITVVSAAGKTIRRLGDSNSHCAGLAPHPETEDDGEDAQSVGIVLEFGKFRFGDFADLTWNKQLALLCPDNRVGKLDLLLAPRHGGLAPQALWGLAPRVTIINNSAKIGAGPQAWKTTSGSPGLEDIWQLHFAGAGGKEANAPDSLIANVEEDGAGDYLKVSAMPDGSFTVFNARNKYTKTYGRGY